MINHDSFWRVRSLMPAYAQVVIAEKSQSPSQTTNTISWLPRKWKPRRKLPNSKRSRSNGKKSKFRINWTKNLSRKHQKLVSRKSSKGSKSMTSITRKRESSWNWSRSKSSEARWRKCLLRPPIKSSIIKLPRNPTSPGPRVRGCRWCPRSRRLFTKKMRQKCKQHSSPTLLSKNISAWKMIQPKTWLRNRNSNITKFCKTHQFHLITSNFQLKIRAESTPVYPL